MIIFRGNEENVRPVKMLQVELLEDMIFPKRKWYEVRISSLLLIAASKKKSALFSNNE